MTRIAINGFGRIGRQVLRIAWDRKDLEIVHVNDLADADTLAHLLEYDSTYGVWDREVRSENGSLRIGDRAVAVTSEKDPATLPWKDAGIDVVLESTGVFRKREQAAAHLDAGARKVLISAPGKSPLDGDFVLGVNDGDYDPNRHHVVSIGSCTTNALAPLAKILHDEFGIVRGFITTIHAYTASQNLLDGPHKDLRRARSAAENVIPTGTGAAQAIGLVLPELEGKLDGMAMRIPVACGSVLDLVCVVERSTEVEKVNAAVARRAEGAMQRIVEVASAPIVSRDVIGNPHSCIQSPVDTFVDENLVKVIAWYDNEWGFSSRVVDMIERMV